MIIPHVYLYAICGAIIFIEDKVSSEKCPEGWSTYVSKCYRHSLDRATWSDALQMCENEGGTLAAITDQTLNDFLFRGDSRYYWVGLAITDDTLEWYWNDGTGFVADYLQWSNFEPTGDSTCARLTRNGQIADRRCQYIYNFICQADINPGSWLSSGHYWFYFSDEMVNQYNASKYCYGRGGYLAREDVFTVLDQRDSSRQYWIGLSRRFWTDGSPYLWHNFKAEAKHPDSLNECYVLHKNEWVPEICYDKNFFICEKEMILTAKTYLTTTRISTSRRTTESTLSLYTTASGYNIPTSSTKRNEPNLNTNIPPTSDTQDIETTLFDEELAVTHTQNGLDITAVAVVMGIVALLLVTILVVIVICRRKNGLCKHSKMSDNETQPDYANVKKNSSVENDSAAEEPGNMSANKKEKSDASHTDYVDIVDNADTNVGKANENNKKLNSNKDKIVSSRQLRLFTTHNDEEVANPYEHIDIGHTNNDYILTEYQSLNVV